MFIFYIQFHDLDRLDVISRNYGNGAIRIYKLSLIFLCHGSFTETNPFIVFSLFPFFSSDKLHTIHYGEQHLQLTISKIVAKEIRKR